MKKALALLLALVMCLSLAACGNSNDSANGKYAILIEMLEAERYDDAIAFIRALKGTSDPSVAETTAASPTAEESHAEETTQPTVPEVSLSEEQMLVLDTVQTVLGSEEFANRQSLYKDFTGDKPRNAEIAKIVHISCDDFDGVAVDGYLVSIAADVAWWIDEAAQRGSTDDHFNIFIDSNSKTVYDSITTDAGNAEKDTTTDEGRAMYLLWIFGNTLDGSYEGNYLNDSETAVEMTADEISLINAELNK